MKNVWNKLAIAAVVAAVLGLPVAQAAAQVFWMPLQERRTQAYVDVSGAVHPRWQWRFVEDARGHGLCVLVLADAQTGQFAIAPVPPESCQ